MYINNEIFYFEIIYFSIFHIFTLLLYEISYVNQYFLIHQIHNFITFYHYLIIWLWLYLIFNYFFYSSIFIFNCLCILIFCYSIFQFYLFKIVRNKSISDVWIVKSSYSWCFHLCFYSWSSQCAFSCYLSLHSWSSQCCFSKCSICCHLCLYSWSSQGIFSCNSVSFDFGSNPWSS